MEEKKQTSGRGGKREGAGRPTGTKKEAKVIFYKRVTAEQKKLLEEYYELIKSNPIIK